MNKQLFYIITGIDALEPFLPNVSPKQVTTSLQLTKDCILFEGSLPTEPTEWDCHFFSFTPYIRSSLIEAVSNKTSTNNLKVFMDKLIIKYNEIVSTIEMHIRSMLSHKGHIVSVMTNLSFGDICIFCPCGTYDYDSLNATVEKVFSLWENKSKALDISDETINSIKQSIMERFDKFYLFKRNPNCNEYRELLYSLMDLDTGSNDRSMYMLLLSALLLRTILDETSSYWVYESGDLKIESFEDRKEPSQVFDLLIASYQKFLIQSKVSSPYADQVWSLFAITKTLLASIVGRDEEDAKLNNIKSLVHNNFFGFVPYVSSRYSEVTSYYPSHLSPDYCYAFLSLPIEHQLKLWSYFPAYIHEFFHYIPPNRRKERNEKILHLAVYSVLAPLYDKMTLAYRNEYEQIVKRVAVIIDQVRQNFYDVRNDQVFHNNTIENIQQSDVEYSRDTMNYNAIMHDLIGFLDFKKICDVVLQEYKNECMVCDELKSTLEDTSLINECVERWNEHMISFIATFSFAMKEIRSDLSMCVMLNIGLKEYIEILANEPAFAESSKEWVAHSTVLRFGFMTRLLFIKEQIGCSSLLETNWDDVCLKMIETFENECSPSSLTKNNKQQNVLLKEWEEQCKKIIYSTTCKTLHSKNFDKRLDNLIDYLDEYKKISSSIQAASEWYSVFERTMCTDEYTLFDEGKENSRLIVNWGNDLNKYSKYSFAHQLSKLYQEYKILSNDLDRHRFEHKSRLLFRDLSMAFPDIDTNRL